MTYTLSRCVLFKGLPTGATLNDLVTGLDKRNLSVLEAHSHIENGRDKIWVVLFSSSEVAKECIKQGSWKVNLPSGEITLSPDYCSEYIVPDNWIQKFEDLDEQNSDESRSIPKEDYTGRCHSICNEQPAMTPILGANVQTVDTDVHDELASDEYIESSSTEKIYQHAKCLPVSREIKSKTQKLNIQTPRMIRVMGLAKSVSMDTLEMFFENKKRCGGGEIESMEWGRNKREAFITFKDPSVVQNILKKQEREPFYLHKMKLTVQEYFPPSTDPLRLFLTNLSPKVNRELLGLYLESRCKAIPNEILLGRKPGTALVSFSEPPDVELMLRQVKVKALEGQYIEVTRVPVTQSVQVTGLKQITSRDTVELYFEHKKRSGGGPVADVRFGRDKQSCVVLFENAEDAERVCKRQHTIDNKDVQVSQYYECLDDNLDGQESSDVTDEAEGRLDEFKLPDPVEVKYLNPQIQKFLMKNERHRQIFEKNLSDINGVVKWPSSLQDYAIIECTVKMEDINVSLVIKNWNSRVVDKVKNFEAGIAVTEFNLIEMTWSVVVKELQTITIDNPEDIGVFLEQEKYKIIVVGPKADVEKLKKTLLDLINKVETQKKLEKQMVKETKSLKMYEINLLRASRFKEDIERLFPGLKFDLNSKEKIATFVCQADIAQKAIAQMHKKLQSFVSGHMQISKPAKDLLWVEEIRHYIKQKMMSQNIIGVWDVVRREEVRMFGRDEEEVQKAIQVVRNCLLEKEILLNEIKQQAIQGQQWLQLVQSLQLKHNRKASIDTTATLILVVALDSIFQDVFDEINSYLEKHSVQETFLSLDPMRIKFIKAYKMKDIKVMEKTFESSAVQFSVIDYGDQKGIKVIGTKDGCKGAKTTLAEMAKNIITKEHVMVNKVGLTEFLQSARGNDQLSSIASRCKCFIALKVSVTPRNLQLEAIKGPAAVGKSSKERSESSSLVFSITIDSESNFKSAVMSLESFVKSEIKEKEINSPRKIILELLDRQVTKMEGMGQGSTVVSVHRQKGVIQVSGTPKEVLETYDSVMKYLHNIERDKMKSEQEILKTRATSALSFPRMWTSMATNENMKCVTLNPGDKEYVAVSQKFLASAGSPYQQGVAIYGRTGINYGTSGFTVINIERVQNKTLYIQYKAMKKQMETKNNGVANEKELWHGTAGNNIANINNNGFNRSYGGSGSHGAGTYFAVNASYSVSGYCNPDANGHCHIYLANVLTGDSVFAGSGTRFLLPKDPRNPHITYDSTTDNTSNPQMFVIFHDTQAYPSYHITFC